MATQQNQCYDIFMDRQQQYFLVKFRCHCARLRRKTHVQSGTTWSMDNGYCPVTPQRRANQIRVDMSAAMSRWGRSDE